MSAQFGVCSHCANAAVQIALEGPANLPPPDVIAADIAADLEAALEQFATISGDLE